MKIMLGADTYAPDVNGAAQFTQRLANGLAARGHEVHVVCPSDRGMAVVDHDEGVTVHRLRSYKYPLHKTLHICLPWEARTATAALAREIGPDVIHIQSHMVVGRGLSRAAEEQGIPLVATNHFMPENCFGYVPLPGFLKPAVASWSWRDLARVFGRADMVTAPTPRAVQLLEESTPIRGARAVSCGIDTERYWAATQSAPATIAPTILFVGRLDQEKRVDELVRAFAALPGELGARLEVIGDGDRKASLIALAERLHIGSAVSFRGFVSETELLASYGRAAVFCMPGVSELQSLVTLEAMSAGKPVVAANAMALPHLVHSGQNGWLFTPGDIGELTVRLSALLGDTLLRQRMGQASREIVAQHSVAATLDQFEDLYDRVTGRPQLAPAQAA